MPNQDKPARAACVRIAILIAIMFLARGCNLGRVLTHAVGQDPIPAKYVLAKVPTLILVKDAPDPTGLNDDAEKTGVEIEEQFNKHELVPVIESGRLTDYKNDHLADFPLQSPAEVGKALKSSQVVFVQIQSSGLAADGVRDMVKGKISASVKVIEVESGKQLFPTDGTTSGLTVSYETPMLRLTDKTTVASVRRNLHFGLADRVSKLFYKYKPDD